MRFFLLLLFVSELCFAYPDKPIRFLIPSGPGGGVDMVARIVSRKMTEKFDKSVIADNRGGAGGIVAFNILLDSPKDGYTIALHNNGIQEEFVKNHSLKEIQTVARQPVALSVVSSLNVKSINEFISYAKTNPYKIHFGHGGIGSVIHIASLEFEKMYGVSFTYLPYKGGYTSILPMFTNETQMVIIGMSAMIPYRQSEKIKILAISGDNRSNLAPEIPTFKEQGYKYNFHIWYSVVTHDNLPKNVTDKLVNVIKNIDSESFTKLGINKWTVTRNKGE